jgi:hypothetical protein
MIGNWYGIKIPLFFAPLWQKYFIHFLLRLNLLVILPNAAIAGLQRHGGGNESQVIR